VVLDEVLVVLGDGDVQPTVRDDAAAVDRILARLRESDEFVVLLVVGKVEARGDPYRFERDFACAFELLDERCELPLARGPVPAAHPDVDGMHFAPADDRHQLVACLLQRERLCDKFRLVAGELDRALVAEEVGRMEHEDVEGVALDPLAAVDEAPERTQLPADHDPAKPAPSPAPRSSGMRSGRCRRSGR